MSVMKPREMSSDESTKKIGGDWQKSMTGGSLSGILKNFFGILFFKKNGPDPVSFSFLFVLSNKHYNSYNK